MSTDPGQLERRNRELSILTSIAAALNSEVDLARSLHVALAQVAEHFGVQAGWIWLLTEPGGEPYLAAAQHLPPALADVPERMEGSCYCLDSFREGSLGGAANISVITCSRLKKLPRGTNGLRYHASVPLYAHAHEVGVMNVASSDWQQLSKEDLQLLHAVGDLLGIAVERARLFAASAQIGALEERNRLAREIHDTLAQGLTAVALQLETADALLEASDASHRARASIQRALELTQRNLEEARRSVLDLRAAPLEGRTLAEALRELVAAQASRHSAAITLETVGATIPLPARVTIGLYRIAQEALGNSMRHAAASQIRLRYEATPARVVLAVADNGSGFDPARQATGHFGLIGMRERSQLLGGSFELQSAPGQGSTITCVIPLESL